jgi:hypothetical protein
MRRRDVRAVDHAILDGLVRVPDAVRDGILPAGVICAVDAKAFATALERRDEARAQATTAGSRVMARPRRRTRSRRR